jgi:hypothetical protein
MKERDFERLSEAPTPNEDRKQVSDVKTYNRSQLFFLDRLDRMYTQEEQAGPDADEFQMKALRRAIFSTLLECEELGVGEEARSMTAARRGRQPA